MGVTITGLFLLFKANDDDDDDDPRRDNNNNNNNNKHKNEPTIESREVTNQTVGLTGPGTEELVQKNSVALWGETSNTLVSSEASITPNGSLNLPGSATIGGDVTIEGVAEMYAFRLSNHSRNLEFNVDAISNSTVRTVFFPDHDVSLGGLDYTWSTVPGDYESVNQAINDSHFKIKVTHDTEENTVLINNVTSATSIVISVDEGVTYDWKDFTIRFFSTGSTLHLSGTKTAPSESSGGIHSASSQMRFSGTGATFFQPNTVGHVNYLSVDNLTLVLATTAVLPAFDGQIISNLINTAYHFPDVSNICQLGYSGGAVYGHCNRCTFHQYTTTSLANQTLVIHNQHLQNTVFYNVGKVVATDATLQHTDSWGSVVRAVRTHLDGYTHSSTGSSLTLDTNTVLTHVQNNLAVTIVGADVRITKSHLSGISLDAGTDCRVSHCVLSMTLDLIVASAHTGFHCSHSTIVCPSVSVLADRTTFDHNEISLGFTGSLHFSGTGLSFIDNVVDTTNAVTFAAEKSHFTLNKVAVILIVSGEWNTVSQSALDRIDITGNNNSVSECCINCDGLITSTAIDIDLSAMSTTSLTSCRYKGLYVNIASVSANNLIVV
jgi:hypothetical protein